MSPTAKPRLVYVVTEDWFFAERFLQMGKAAQRQGFDVYVVARERDHRAQIEAEGMTLIPLEADRQSVNPFDFMAATLRLRRILTDIAPAIVHCIAIKGIVLGGLASKLAGIKRCVFAPTGFGVFADGAWSLARPARRAVIGLIRHQLETPQTKYLFENAEDPAVFGLSANDADKVRIVGGTGVDPVRFAPTEMPPQPPLRAAIVSRMLWAKGIDTAVEAVTLARNNGADVELSLYGAPDSASRQSISQDQLNQWSQRDGITWHGPTKDVPAVWRNHHVCLLPSHGEGMPSALLEGAASGRVLLATDVPGCRDLIRNDIDGVLIKRQDSNGLADALARLAASDALVRELGIAARKRVLQGYTKADVAQRIEKLYGDMKT